MLDNTTKQKINTLRDILVGKVSDPKSQVEQITIALFYKFMEDMDNELKNDLGVEAKFFSGEYAKYSWRNLFAPSLGGENMLNLYREAVEKMEENPNIPSAFRDIFKRAYLPYNDPATLRMFLKVIDDGFHYSNSEMLGDAFEYLLSILGTQGDAGQFRTPRHIIDFITACVNPKKGDVICDPACGTAGFVIAAYKHILKQNTKTNIGDLLSAEDKKKLAQNLIGLDIDPMMVKLALANMYLHGFNDPHIYEYDSLTSEDKWDDTYDVVLANPPFMTPKGGIRPHKRFTTQANKAEVLFVDLISSHLTANGRAGIIVPNGIVATTQKAYKNLRKILIEDSLIAVVSLPAGVFQPYSGVKTSVLILDKALNKKSDSVLFIKIENDGFDLGSQRRKIDKNDLPTALECINNFKTCLSSESKFTTETDELDCLLVKKEAILKSRDNILSGERYKMNKVVNSKFPIKKLVEIAEIIMGQSPKGEFYNSVKEGLPFYQGRTDFGENELNPPKQWTSQTTKISFKNDILMSVRAPVGPVNMNPFEKICIGRGLTAIRPKKNLIIGFCYIYLKSIQDKIIGNTGTVFNSINKVQIEEIQIPLPPLEIQEKIVKEIEGYQKIIDGAKMVVDNYKPTINIKPEWEMVELGSVCVVQRGKFSHRPRNEPRFFGGDYPFIQTGDVVKAKGGVVGYKQTLNEDGLSVSKLFKPTIVLLTIAANIGDTAILDYEACFTDSVVGLIPNDLNKLNPYFLQVIMSQMQDELNEIAAATQSAQKNLSVSKLSPTMIPIPAKEEQEAIVKQIEIERKIVDANKQLIQIYEQKIKNRIAQVWGEG